MISRIHGRKEFILSRNGWLCPSVDLLWGRDGKRNTQASARMERFGLLRGNWSWSCVPSSVVHVESRYFTSQSTTYWDSRTKWDVIAHGSVASATHKPSAIRGSTTGDAGVGVEVKDGAESLRKKKVALWVGYVGTDYRGLQIVRGPDAVKTIEGELEKAIFKAGGILESNYGHLEKVGWSRSSRTDKGAHSLATVITMKMELHPTAWLSDTDGFKLAESINVHLPPTIRVFGVVSVTKSFDARRFCCSRTYHYLLPATLTGIGEDTAPEVIGELIENFRQILSQFVAKPDVALEPGDDDVDEDVHQHEPQVETLDVNANLLAETLDVKAYWLNAPNKADKLGPSHFRRVLECSCGGLEVGSGARFIRISKTGESFMVHHIRKMVATAVSVARGLLPNDVITLALCRHTRVVLPLAPSEGLLLATISFYPYRQLQAPASERAFRESEVGVERLKKVLPKLQMSNRIEEKVDSFWRDILLPEMAPLLDESLPHWTFWLSCLESQGFISEEEIAEVRTKWTNWREQSRLKMEAAMAHGIPISEVDEDVIV